MGEAGDRRENFSAALELINSEELSFFWRGREEGSGEDRKVGIRSWVSGLISMRLVRQ